MHLVVATDEGSGSVTLAEPDDFKRFHVEAPGGDDAALGRALEAHEAGRLDGEHVWVPREALRRLAGEAATPAWEQQLAGMIDYARTKGWVDEEQQAIRAHLVRAT